MERDDCMRRLLALDEAGHDLIAAVIALVRARVENNIYTENTAEILACALAALDRGEPDECERQAGLVRQEKNILAPDCAVCPNPCARTAEYPISEFLSEDTVLQAMKAELLFDIISHSCSEADFDEACRKLYMFGYEKDLNRFLSFIK